MFVVGKMSYSVYVDKFLYASGQVDRTWRGQLMTEM